MPISRAWKLGQGREHSTKIRPLSPRHPSSLSTLYARRYVFFFLFFFFYAHSPFLSPLLLVVLSLSSSSHPPHPFPPITVSLISVHRRKRQLEGRFPYARWISHDCIIGYPVPLLHTPGFLFHPLFQPGSSDLQFLGESINMQSIHLSFFFSRFVTSNGKFIIS